MPFSQDKPILKKDPTDTEFTDGKAVFISVMSIMNVLMFFGNTLSIITITTNKRLRKQVSYWFVLNLAVIDFLIAVTVVPLNIVWEYYGSWPLNKASCEVFTFADISFSTISAYSIVLVSIDKYVYITYPMQYVDKMTKKIALILIVAVWIMVLTFTVISVSTEVGTTEEFRDHFYTVTNNTQTCLFVMTDTYVIPSALICFFIPLTILSFTSSRIICIASNHIRKIHEISVCLPSETNSDIKRTLSAKYQPQKSSNVNNHSPKPSPLFTSSGICSKSETNKNSLVSSKQIQEQTENSSCQGNELKTNGVIENNQTCESNYTLECDNVSVTLKRDRTVSINDEKHDGKELEQTVPSSGEQYDRNSQTENNKQNNNSINKLNGSLPSIKNSLKKSESIRTISQRKYPYCKLFGTVTIVILCFVIMFSPYYVATMVDVACHCVDPWIYEDILSVLYYMHSLVNPYIYMSTDRKYKAALRLLCRRIFKQ